MRNRFLLFGEKPFDIYAAEKFADIAADISRMSDVEILMHKDSFGDLVNRTHAVYIFPDLEILFENKLVDLVEKPGLRQSRYFAEYSLVVKGNSYFLGLSPYVSNYRPVDLLIEVRKDFMSFEIDTGYHSEDLTPEVTAQVKKEYDRIKRFITTAQNMLNVTIHFYNREMKEFISSQLANKLRKAEKCMKIKESLNFD